MGAAPLLRLRAGEPYPDLRSTWVERAEVLPALEKSIQWTRSPHAAGFFPAAGISYQRALRSLEQFRALLDTASSADDFQRGFEAVFDVYRSAGWDGRGGGVLFTGYCTPLLRGSLTPSREFPHPLHALPPDLLKATDGTILGQETRNGVQPYPTRAQITRNEAYKTLEIAWLADPIDAYIANVNGSAFVKLPSGEIARFGYAGNNGRPYTSLGQLLIDDGLVPAQEMGLPAIRRWARENPGLVRGYLDRNERYVFFTPIQGNPRGSLNVEVTEARSLATDKELFPPGALCFVDTELPSAYGESVSFRQLMLDQDTGGAIRTAGRADIYLGVGPKAERLSGATKAPGQLYYFFVREGRIR